MVKRKKS